jgi:hypothetical protein
MLWTVWNKIDANLTPSNIKKDVTIFGVTWWLEQWAVSISWWQIAWFRLDREAWFSSGDYWNDSKDYLIWQYDNWTHMYYMLRLVKNYSDDYSRFYVIKVNKLTKISTIYVGSLASYTSWWSPISWNVWPSGRTVAGIFQFSTDWWYTNSKFEFDTSTDTFWASSSWQHSPTNNFDPISYTNFWDSKYKLVYRKYSHSSWCCVFDPFLEIEPVV